jgi:hypothetical protein
MLLLLLLLLLLLRDTPVTHSPANSSVQDLVQWLLHS